MKKILLAAFAAFGLVSSMVYFTSCGTEDLCATVDCGPHGKCNAITGTCDCDPGYKKDTNGRCDLLIDPCTGVDCGTNGTCDKGACNCATGYEKDLNGKCNILTKEKFYGDYNGEDFDAKGVSVTKYSSNIASVASDVTKITIKNLGNYECKNTTTGGALDYTVDAKVKGDSISIDYKTCNNLFVGKGYYDKAAKVLTINYTATYGTPAKTDINKAVLKKK